MVQYIPPPDPRSLLPPLLACLPTSFVSPRPPPALLPLLSPILRHKLDFLATSSSSSDSWLPLLCWDSELAQQVVDTVADSDAFELHPTSGEIEIGSIKPIEYRRLDEDTLQARIAAPDIGLVIVVLWCAGSEDGENSGWRVAELRPFQIDDERDSSDWHETMAEAEDQGNQKAFDEATRSESGDGHTAQDGADIAVTDEDDYWAQYDKTPGRTPGPDQPPLAGIASSQNRQARSTSEAEYFERYAEVQPEMDNDDSSQDKTAIGDSTLHGNTLAHSENGTSRTLERVNQPSSSASQDQPYNGFNQPAVAPTESGASTVSRLEQIADSQSTAVPVIRQHVSTSVKSLFRLCRGSGMERSEFENLVQTELQALSIVDGVEQFG